MKLGLGGIRCGWMNEDAEQPPIVLVVDDESLLRLYACDLLEGAGYRVVEAQCCASAIEVMEATPGVRLLFTDVQMPGPRDGLELAREVHARWPDVLLLVTSGEAKLTHADVPGRGRFVAKPYKEDKLLGHVAGLIAGEPIDPS